MIAQGVQPVPRWRTAGLVVPTAMVAAGGVGWLAAVDPRYAVAACATMIAVPAALFRPKLIVYLLILTIYASTFQISDVTAQRLAANCRGGLSPSCQRILDKSGPAPTYGVEGNAVGSDFRGEHNGIGRSGGAVASAT